MKPEEFSPLECARRAHRNTAAPAGLDARILAEVRENETVRSPLRAPAWVPVFTTCAVLALGLWLAPWKRAPRGADSGSTPAASNHATANFSPAVQRISVERQEIFGANLPVAGAFSLRLWEEGETGVRSILDEGTLYQAARGVELELLSSFATLEKKGDAVVQLSGTVRWHADPPAGNACLVEAAGWLFSAANAVFTLDVSPREVTLDVHAGDVTGAAGGASGPRYRLAEGQHAKLPVRPERVIARPASHVWTREEIEGRLRSFAEKQAHSAAAEFVNRILPEVDGSLRESLLFDLASIYGHYLRDWDRACLTLDRLVREFPATPLMEGVEQLRSRYRCPGSF